MYTYSIYIYIYIYIHIHTHLYIYTSIYVCTLRKLQTVPFHSSDILCQAVLERLAEYGRKPHRLFVWLKQVYHRPHFFEFEISNSTISVFPQPLSLGHTCPILPFQPIL